MVFKIIMDRVVLTNGNGAIDFKHSSSSIPSLHIEWLHSDIVFSIGETPHDEE